MGELNLGSIQNNLVIRWQQHPELPIWGIPLQFQSQVLEDFVLPIVVHYSSGVDSRNNTMNMSSSIAAPVVFNPSSANVPAQGYSDSIAVSTSVEGFAWKAATSDSWIALPDGAIGAGNAAIAYSVSANPGTAARVGTVMVAGVPFAIRQDGTGALSGKAILVSPSATIYTPSPTYTWKAVAAATWYYLWVNENGTAKIQTWYPAEQAGCATGTGTCSVTPAAQLAGACQWWIQTWNSAGYGSWSDGMTFTISGSPPGTATLVLPSRASATASPTYVWNAVSGLTWYYLWVNDASSTPKIRQWYTAAQAGCASGTETCAITPSATLASGRAQWWIQTWNDAGYGSWSDGMRFTVP